MWRSDSYSRFVERFGANRAEQTEPSKDGTDLSPPSETEYQVPKETEEQEGLRKFFDGLGVPEEGITE